MQATVKFEIVISKQGTTKETGGHIDTNLFEKMKELRSLDVLTNYLQQKLKCYKSGEKKVIQNLKCITTLHGVLFIYT